MDFRLLIKAGISQGEFAKLVGSSRVMVNYWIHGKAEPHPVVRDRVEGLLQQIAQAIDADALPLSLSVARRDRVAQLRKVLNTPPV
jgi:transcriptional regulator with XRE-family HTH domain